MVGSRLELVVLELVDLVLEAWRVVMVELGDVAAAEDAVVAADAVVEVDAVVEADEVEEMVIDVVKAVVNKGWTEIQPNRALTRRALPSSPHCLWPNIRYCTF